MLPSIGSLARERELLAQVLSSTATAPSVVAVAAAAAAAASSCAASVEAAEPVEDVEVDAAGSGFFASPGGTPHGFRRSAPPALEQSTLHSGGSCSSSACGQDGRPCDLQLPRTAVAKASRGRSPRIEKVANQLAHCDSLHQLPRELLAEIAEQFLESPVWHLCQLGETSPQLGQIFMDDALWHKAFQERFRDASTSPRRRSHSRSPSPSARLSYAQFHLLEMRFRGGMYNTKSKLDNPHRGVAVLDLRIAPGVTSTTAFASLRNGSIMVYDLAPPVFKDDADSDIGTNVTAPTQAAPLRELSPSVAGGPALCCFPIELAQSVSAPALLLVAGYAHGHIGTWDVSSQRPLSTRALEEAHVGRVSALANIERTLLSASSDNLVKSWDLDSERFGTQVASFLGHSASVVSLAAAPGGSPLFLTGSHDRTVRLWDLRQGGDPVARVQQHDWVTCVDFHPTKIEQVFSSDKRVHLWDLRRPGGNTLSSSHCHRKLISKFRVDPLRLASCSLDGSVKVSSLEDPSRQRASPHPSPEVSPHRGPRASPGVPVTAFGSSDVSTVRTSSDYVLCIDFDATRLLAGGVDGRVDVYDFSDPTSFAGVSCASPALKVARCGEPVDSMTFSLPGMET